MSPFSQRAISASSKSRCAPPRQTRMSTAATTASTANPAAPSAGAMLERLEPLDADVTGGSLRARDAVRHHQPECFSSDPFHAQQIRRLTEAAELFTELENGRGALRADPWELQQLVGT